MATQAIAGYAGTVQVSDDGGSSYGDIGELVDVSLDAKVDMLDATSHASAGAKEFVPGNSEWTATASLLFVATDTVQDKIKAALIAKTKCKFKFRPQGAGSGKEEFTGDGYFDGWKFAAPTSDLVKVDVSIRGTGALGNANQ